MAASRSDAQINERTRVAMMLGWTENDRCGVCGHHIEIVLTAAGCSIGRTLDGHELVQNNDPIGYEVDRCPNCGFCSPTIRDPKGVSLDDLRNPIYRRMLERRSPYECAAYLLSIHGHHRDAAYMLLHGAWLSDGDGIWLRNLAIREMLKVKPIEEDAIVMTDMLRCVGEPGIASIVAKAILSREGNAPLWKRARIELKLIQAGNTRREILLDDIGRSVDDVFPQIEISETNYLRMTSSEDIFSIEAGMLDKKSESDIVIVRAESSGRETGFIISNPREDVPSDEMVSGQSVVLGSIVDHMDDAGDGTTLCLHLRRGDTVDVWPFVYDSPSGSFRVL